MKTQTPPLQALGNDYLQNILAQRITRHSVIQVFYDKPQLVIHCAQKKDADEIALQKWTRRAFEQYGISVCCWYSAKLLSRFKMGYPFIQRYCRPSAVVYENAAAGQPLHIAPNWKKYHKRFSRYTQQHHTERDSQLSQIKMLISENAANSVFTAFERLFEMHIGHLEELFTGNTNGEVSLDNRITGLIAFIPQIQSLFVAESPGKHYLTAQFGKAGKGIENEDTFVDEDLFGALSVVETALFGLVEARRKGLKKEIKKASRSRQQPLAIGPGPKYKLPDGAMDTILKFLTPEQIYCFRHDTCGPGQIFYLLLIGQGMGSQNLERVTQSLRDTLGPQYGFLLLGHTRSSIQKNLYCCQGFFQEIAAPQNLIYASHPYHPTFHWIAPFSPYHADLFLHYRSAMQSARQFRSLAAGAAQPNHGLECLFALAFMSFCKAYINAKTYYFPAGLSPRAIWYLALYADPALYKFRHLLDEFPGDFFAFLNRHTTLYGRSSSHGKDQLVQMENIVSQFEVALHNLVIEGGLVEEDGDCGEKLEL